MENRKTRKRQNQMGQEKGNCILQIPGRTAFPGAKAEKTQIWKLFEKNHGFSPEQLPQTPYTKWFDYGIIKSNLTVRTRTAGDFIVIDKEGDRQKLKSWFINRKIPAEQRDGILTGRRGKRDPLDSGISPEQQRPGKSNTKKILQIEVNGG